MAEDTRDRGLWQLTNMIFWLTFLLLLSSEASAAKLYVSDTTLETILRTGPGVEYRINASVEVGTAVTLLKEEKEWAQVALADGRTGWIWKRYLSEQPPWRITADKLTAENKVLRAEVNQLRQGKQESSEELGKLKRELEAGKRELASVRQEYEALKKGATEYVSLKSAFAEVTAEAKEAKVKLQDVEQEHRNLKTSTAIRWFLAGAGALILGWLLGFSMASMRRRRATGIYR